MSVKYEDIYLKDYATVADLIEGLGRYFEFYDHARKHQALDYKTPREVWYGARASRASHATAGTGRSAPPALS